MRAVRVGAADAGVGVDVGAGVEGAASGHRGGSSSAHGHRHTLPGQHEHDFEPERGLPEALPADERLLWQASPDWRELAVHRFHARKLAVYFALMLALKLVVSLSGGQAFAAAAMAALPLLLLSAFAVGLVTLLAWLTARTTVYTLTDKRVVMRIGVVLTLTLNLPLRHVAAAAVHTHGAQDGDVGDIALQLLGTDRVAYLHLWPHARRWRIARPEPTLLCVPDAAKLSQQLTAAWLAVQPDDAAVELSPATPAVVTAQPLQQPTAKPALQPSPRVQPGFAAH